MTNFVLKWIYSDFASSPPLHRFESQRLLPPAMVFPPWAMSQIRSFVSFWFPILFLFIPSLLSLNLCPNLKTLNLQFFRPKKKKKFLQFLPLLFSPSTNIVFQPPLLTSFIPISPCYDAFHPLPEAASCRQFSIIDLRSTSRVPLLPFFLGSPFRSEDAFNFKCSAHFFLGL